MYLFVILIYVLFWDILTVDSKFYLEKTTPETISQGFKAPAGGYGEQLSWFLYECDITGSGIHSKSISNRRDNAIRCTQIEDHNQQQRVYAVVNFTCVTDLELLAGSTIEIDGEVFTTGYLPEVLVVGTQPRPYLRPNFKPAAEDGDRILNKCFQNLAPFVDFSNVEAAKILLRFFSINNVDYFLARIEPPAKIFSSFAVVLETIIMRSGYSVGKGPKGMMRADSSLAFDTRHRSKSRGPFQTTTQSKSFKKSFSTALGKFMPRLSSRRQARSESKIRSQSQSKSRPRSPSDPPSPVWDPSPAPLIPPFMSPFTLPPAAPVEPKSFSLPEAQIQFPYQSSSLPPASPWRTPTQSPPMSSMPSNRALSYAVQLKIDFMKAVGYMSLKMFDPCFVLNLGSGEKKQAQSNCELYCQFLGMAINIYEYVYSDSCRYLQKGQCKNKMCICETGTGSEKKGVNMVFCNNALRFYIYEKGWQAFWP